MVFLARVILAAIDHNMHVFRPQATTRDRSLKFARKYSKRTKNWHAEPVKIEKDYNIGHSFCPIFCVDAMMMQVQCNTG